ncbi:MAG: hypothetical protein KGL25_02140 [Gammaproteobacteria bacterium]|nr:hypothetical protein [Gammaproteobacteria bacterium]
MTGNPSAIIHALRPLAGGVLVLLGGCASTPMVAPEPATTAPPTSTELYAYPKNGQNREQQATDRYECHRWASDQSGFDPTQPLGGVSSADADAKRDAYQRAQRACLEGRGYSVN